MVMCVAMERVLRVECVPNVAHVTVVHFYVFQFNSMMPYFPWRGSGHEACSSALLHKFRYAPFTLWQRKEVSLGRERRRFELYQRLYLGLRNFYMQ